MDLSTVLSSTLLAGLVAALISLCNSERKIHVENVTQERAKWRAEMRVLSDVILKAARDGNVKEIERLCAQLRLNVNPFDIEDRELINTVMGLFRATNLDSSLNEFTNLMALLLKHDWERAKREANPWFFRGSQPRRIPYCEYLHAVAGSTTLIPAKKSVLRLTAYFGALTFSAGIMFFLAAGLTEPFQDLVRLFNDSKTEKPLAAWFQFMLLSAFSGSIWSGAYLWFKGSEKKFLDIWFSK